MEIVFAGKTALVTGAGSGIGRDTALAFASAGAGVAVVDVDVGGGEETAAQARARGVQAEFIHADVSDRGQVEALMREVLARFGRLDMACNNAGIEGLMAPTAECTEENWDRVIAVNLKGVWLCLRAEIPVMLATGGGAIVNMASVAGLVGFPNLPAYCAAKGGVVQLTRTAALEYAKQGIRINTICPGGVCTPMVDRIVRAHPEMDATLNAMHPLGRMCRPPEIADAVLWLCSDAASFVTGQALAVDGGYTAQ